MRKIIIGVFLGLFLISLASAIISLEEEPNSIYNLGETIKLRVDIVPSPEINDLVILYLSCSGSETEIYKEYMYLTSSTQKDVIVPLVKNFIGDSKGKCSIKSKIGEDKRTISEEFTISNWIDVNAKLNEAVEPGKTLKIQGTANLENTNPVEGEVEAKISGGVIYGKVAVKNGVFELPLTFPSNFKSGNYKIEISVYEKDSSGEITNNGNYIGSISVLQIPTNLEIILDENKIVPGTEVSGVVYLYDQTGEEMESKVYLALKNGQGETVEQLETFTNDLFTYEINRNESAGIWSVSTYSEELITRMNFEILENKEVSVLIANKTLIIENVGNVPYLDVVPVKVGEQMIDVSVDLDLGEVSKFKLSAPQGEYEVSANGVSSRVSLTGNSIKVEALKEGDGQFKIFLWAFIVLILGVSSYFLFKRARNKSFFGKRTGRKSKKKLDLKEIPGPSPLMDSKVKAELSLSISGTKQNSPMGCIYIKNYEEVQSGDGGVRETLEQISNLVGERKGLVYENRGNIFYFIPPVKTKTFQNEIPILNLTEDIKNVLDTHNKKFKGKIQYGISLNFGTIVTRNEAGTFKFMSMGTLMTNSKKISSKSVGEILMSDKFKEKVDKEVKAERVEVEGANVYKFLGYIKSNTDHSKFIKGFLERQKKTQ